MQSNLDRFSNGQISAEVANVYNEIQHELDGLDTEMTAYITQLADERVDRLGQDSYSDSELYNRDKTHTVAMMLYLAGKTDMGTQLLRQYAEGIYGAGSEANNFVTARIANWDQVKKTLAARDSQASEGGEDRVVELMAATRNHQFAGVDNQDDNHQHNATSLATTSSATDVIAPISFTPTITMSSSLANDGAGVVQASSMEVGDESVIHNLGGVITTPNETDEIYGHGRSMTSPAIARPQGSPVVQILEPSTSDAYTQHATDVSTDDIHLSTTFGRSGDTRAEGVVEALRSQNATVADATVDHLQQQIDQSLAPITEEPQRSLQPKIIDTGSLPPVIPELVSAETISTWISLLQANTQLAELLSMLPMFPSETASIIDTIESHTSNIAGIVNRVAAGHMSVSAGVDALLTTIGIMSMPDEHMRVLPEYTAILGGDATMVGQLRSVIETFITQHQNREATPVAIAELTHAILAIWLGNSVDLQSPYEVAFASIARLTHSGRYSDLPSDLKGTFGDLADVHVAGYQLRYLPVMDEEWKVSQESHDLAGRYDDSSVMVMPSRLYDIASMGRNAFVIQKNNNAGGEIYSLYAVDMTTMSRSTEALATADSAADLKSQIVEHLTATEASVSAPQSPVAWMRGLMNKIDRHKGGGIERRGAISGDASSFFEEDEAIGALHSYGQSASWTVNGNTATLRLETPMFGEGLPNRFLAWKVQEPFRNTRHEQLYAQVEDIPGGKGYIDTILGDLTIQIIRVDNQYEMFGMMMSTDEVAAFLHDVVFPIHRLIDLMIDYINGYAVRNQSQMRNDKEKFASDMKKDLVDMLGLPEEQAKQFGLATTSPSS